MKNYYGHNLTAVPEPHQENPAFVGTPRQARTLRAISRIAGEHPAEMWAVLQDGWDQPGVHSVTYLVNEGWGIVGETTLTFETLTSGRIGWWMKTTTDHDDDEDSPCRETRVTAGKGQW